MKTCLLFVATLCLSASFVTVYAHGQDGVSLQRFRRLVKNQAAVRLVEPYTQVSEEDAVRRLIQNGGSMQDVVDLSLEYQLADETARRLVDGTAGGTPHSRLKHHSYTPSRFNDIPLVLKVVKDGVSYVVEIAVQMLKAGKSIGHVIRSLNNVTKAETLDWYRNFASFDTQKLMTSACATYEINACMELMSPAVYNDLRETEHIYDNAANGYSAYFGSHACSDPSALTVDTTDLTTFQDQCDEYGTCTGEAFAVETAFNTEWRRWVNDAKNVDTQMSIEWEDKGHTVKDCNQYFQFTCAIDATNDDKQCKGEIVRGETTRSGDTIEDDPSSANGTTTFDIWPPTISTRNKYTMDVFNDERRGAVYQQCDEKTIEMYERIKHQIFGHSFVSTSGCKGEIYGLTNELEEPKW